jgi:1,4-dihydroxy-2-naphthoate octaprenyltransferase/chlorophyll synthase
VAQLPRTFTGRWLHALKPASWPKLLVPALLGQAIGYGATGELSIGGALFGAVFTLLDLAFVVLLNDFGDREVDRVKRAMFPSTSPKTIPDGVLPPHHVLFAGLAAGVLAVGVALVSSPVLGRPLLVPATLACIALFVAYTLPPLRLNYRGGGELLEMLGVGVALPWLNAYAQSGELLPNGLLAMLPGFALLALASALASGLSDEVSDRRGGKRTFTTMLGNPAARRATELLTLLGVVAWGVAIFFADLEMKAALIMAAGTAWDYLVRMRRVSPSAVTNAFAAHSQYKRELHAGMWRGAIYASLALVALTWWWSP